MKINTKKWIGVFLMILCNLVLPAVVNPWATLTKTGVAVLFILIGFIAGMLTMDDLMLPTIFSMAGAVTYCGATANDVFAAYLGNSIIVQMIFLFAICYLVSRDDTGKALVAWAFSRKIFQKTPMLLLFAMAVIFGIVACLVNVFGALILLFPILRSVCNLADIPEDSKFGRLLFLGCFIATNLGSNLTSPMYPYLVAYVDMFGAAAGTTLNALEIASLSGMILLVFSALYALSMKYVFKCDLQKLVSFDISDVFKNQSVRFTKRQIIPLIGFLLVAIYSFTSGFWPNVGIFAVLKNMGSALFTILVFGVLCLIVVDGKPLCNPVEAMKNVSWPLLFGIGALIYISGLFSNSEFGIVPWISQALNGIFGEMNAFVLLIFTVVVTFIVTNFISNMATMYMMGAIILPLVAGLANNFSIIVFPVATMIAANVSYLTPAASGQAGLLFSNKNITMKFLWSHGLIMTAILLFSLVLIFGLRMVL